jgi:hypothetical protein
MARIIAEIAILTARTIVTPTSIAEHLQQLRYEVTLTSGEGAPPFPRTVALLSGVRCAAFDGRELSHALGRLQHRHELALPGVLTWPRPVRAPAHGDARAGRYIEKLATSGQHRTIGSH